MQKVKNRRHTRALAQAGGPLGALAMLSTLSAQDGAVLDVGVNRGTVARHLLRLFPERPTYLIEPLPQQVPFLRERFAKHPNVEVAETAFGDREGRIGFNVCEQLGTSSIYGNEEARARGLSRFDMIERIEVDLTTLDAFCEGRGIERVACMKIDAQGSEHAILEGGARMLAEERVDILMFEYFSAPYYDGVPLLGDILGTLSRHRYGLYDIFPIRKRTFPGSIMGDAVAVSERFRRERIEA